MATYYRNIALEYLTNHKNVEINFAEKSAIHFNYNVKDKCNTVCLVYLREDGRFQINMNLKVPNELDYRNDVRKITKYYAEVLNKYNNIETPFRLFFDYSQLFFVSGNFLIKGDYKTARELITYYFDKVFDYVEKYQKPIIEDLMKIAIKFD